MFNYLKFILWCANNNNNLFKFKTTNKNLRLFTNLLIEEFTSENFMQCTTQILTSIVSYFMQPFYYISDLIAKLVGVLQKAINSVRQVLFMIRKAMDKIMSYIVARLVNVMIPLRLIVGKLRDTMNKTIGIATAALYTVYFILHI